MCCVNNLVIMQTEQLGRIETLKEKLHSLEGCNQTLEHKLAEQDCVITNLVGNNLDYLQDNMRLMGHINSSQTWMANLEWKLTELGELFLVVMGQSSSDQGTSDAGGDDKDDQDGGEDNVGAGASQEGSTRGDSPLLREGRLILVIEREAEEAGAGGWFNRMDQGILESWSGHNSNVLASQDQVRTTGS